MTKLEKVMVWGSTAAVTATGLVYSWMKYMLQPVDTFAVINHPLQPLVLKLHIVTAPFLVFGVGMIAMRHIWPHFKAGLRKGRRSGISSMLLLVPMIATGYALQALTSAPWLRAIGLIHLGLGVVFAIGAAIHYAATTRNLKISRQAEALKQRPLERTGT
jgi:hypothetical protein